MLGGNLNRPVQDASLASWTYRLQTWPDRSSQLLDPSNHSESQHRQIKKSSRWKTLELVPDLSHQYRGGPQKDRIYFPGYERWCLFVHEFQFSFFVCACGLLYTTPIPALVNLCKLLGLEKRGMFHNFILKKPWILRIWCNYKQCQIVLYTYVIIC